MEFKVLLAHLVALPEQLDRLGLKARKELPVAQPEQLALKD
jgi:hypothetical protein